MVGLLPPVGMLSLIGPLGGQAAADGGGSSVVIQHLSLSLT